MSQGTKIIAGFLAILTLVLIASAFVWLTATVNQLSKDKDRLDLTTQKLADNADKLAEKVESLENQNANVRGDVREVRKDVEGLNTVVEDLISATGRQLSDIKKVIVEQDNQINGRIDVLETENAASREQIKELNRHILSSKSKVESVPKVVAKPSGRIFVDINNPGGHAGWEDSYTVQLHFVVADEQSFLIDWYNPHVVSRVTPDRPDTVKKTPKFKNANQLYFLLKLGDAADNRITGVIDFAATDKEYFPFDLYLDKDRDGDLAKGLVETESSTQRVRGIKIAYKDGTTEEYALKIYTHQGGGIGIWYASEAGRYGILEANQKRIGILVLDNTGNGLFNDSEDVIFIDENLDGQINGSHEAHEDRPLYSILDLSGEKYRVTEIDPAGRHLTLTRMH